MVSKNKNNHKNYPIFITLLTIVLAALVFSVVYPTTQTTNTAKAQSISELDEKIAALKNEISQNKAQADQLAAKAESLQATINGLNLEIKSIQDEIDLTEAEISKLTQKLKQTRKELEEQKEILAKSLREHYKLGDVSTLELFATAENFSDFFNQKEYLDRVRSSIHESSQEVARLEKSLEQQRYEQENLLQRQEAQRNTLSSKKAEKNQLLIKTQSQESRFRSLVSQNRQELDEARKEQARLIAAAQRSVRYGGTGGYPWANVEPWNFNSCSFPKYVDDWGMCVRQCVSYTAWAVQRDHELGLVKYDMPYWGGRGDAWKWIGNAQDAGIPTGSTPKPGAIAISTAGTYGHAMYVESVVSNSEIYVSQYNASFNGEYSEATRSSSGLTYIYFQEWE